MRKQQIWVQPKHFLIQYQLVVSEQRSSMHAHFIGQILPEVLSDFHMVLTTNVILRLQPQQVWD